ncbi:enoyl-CoA hydratase/isomerase family protein [Ramlibacter sp.]|uniref:enoyl-CoA hydratase/isomerase family protein n=1 Tax=Ramlibacter sp. TaxID=1917967 RepID=UPI003D0B39DA
MIRYEVKEGVAVVALARPERLNALTFEMREALAGWFEQAARDDKVRSVLLRGEGRAFCAGGDVGSIADSTPEANAEVGKMSHRMILNLVDIQKPVIVAVRGAVAGIGWSLALACDIVLASDNAKFAQVFRNIGLVPDGGAVWFLTRYVGALRAKELVFSGRRVEAQEALSLGLATRVVADAELDAVGWQTALDYASAPTRALGAGKKLFRFVHQPDLVALLEVEAAAQATAIRSFDHREGIAAFLEKRPARFEGR